MLVAFTRSRLARPRPSDCARSLAAKGLSSSGDAHYEPIVVSGKVTNSAPLPTASSSDASALARLASRLSRTGGCWTTAISMGCDGRTSHRRLLPTRGGRMPATLHRRISHPPEGGGPPPADGTPSAVPGRRSHGDRVGLERRGRRPLDSQRCRDSPTFEIAVGAHLGPELGTRTAALPIAALPIGSVAR